MNSAQVANVFMQLCILLRHYVAMLKELLCPLVCMQGIQNLESLASVLSQCLSKWRRFGTPAQSSCPQLQLVCWTTLHLAVCLGKLLDIQGPHTSGVSQLMHSTVQKVIVVVDGWHELKSYTCNYG